MNITSKRIEWIDVAKGLAIFLVIVGHTIHPHSFSWTVIFTFHMPVFFIISGFLYKPRDPSEIVAKKSKRLLIPYISTCLILLVGEVISLYLRHANVNEIMFNVKNLLLAFLYGSGVTPPQPELFSNIWEVGMLWFLLTLLLAELLFSVFMKITKNMKSTCFPLVIFFVAVLGYAISRFVFLPWNFDLAMIALIYLYIGFIARKYSLGSAKIPLYLLFLMTLLLLLFINVQKMTVAVVHGLTRILSNDQKNKTVL